MPVRITILLLLFLTSLALSGQTKTELQPEELQKPIVQYIAKNYPGYAIDKAFKVDTRGVITFDVCLYKDKNYEKLFFDKEGNYLRKESCSRECCMGPRRK